MSFDKEQGIELSQQSSPTDSTTSNTTHSDSPNSSIGEPLDNTASTTLDPRINLSATFDHVVNHNSLSTGITSLVLAPRSAYFFNPRLERGSETISPMQAPEADPRLESPTDSITQRIANDFSLRAMQALPEINFENQPEAKSQYNRMSIVTPDGLYQFDDEYNMLRQRLSAQQLKDAGFESLLLPSDVLEAQPENGCSLYGQLNIEQLKQLEQLVRDHRGYTIIGYTINEELFLKALALTLALFKLDKAEYPPMPEALSLRTLNWMKQPLVRDIWTAIRSLGKSFLLISYVISVYRQYDTDSTISDDAFFVDNMPWYLLGISIVATIEFLSLRLSQNRDQMLSRIERWRLLEESFIGACENWSTFGALIFPATVVEYGLLPATLYGLHSGLYDTDEMYTQTILNVANRTSLKMVWSAISYSLTHASFFRLGMWYFVQDIVFAKQISDDQGITDVVKYVSIIQYTIFAIATLFQLTRDPRGSKLVQRFGRYTSNATNAMANVMLDNLGLFQFLCMVQGLLVGDHPSGAADLTGYYGLQAIVFIAVLLGSYPVTPDLPELSLESNPFEKNCLNSFIEKKDKLLKFFSTQNAETNERESSSTNNINI